MIQAAKHPSSALHAVFAVALSTFSGNAAQVPPPPSEATQTKVITLQQALRLAKIYSPQFQTAATNAAVARENRHQAWAARLPAVNALNQFIYTEGNGTPSGVFIANDGVHVYNEEAVLRENLFSIVRRGQSLQAQAAEAVALAQKEIVGRGLVFTVVQDYYGVAGAERKSTNAQRSLQEAKDFVEITEKQEFAGQVSHVDVVKAQLQFEQRLRDLENARLATDQARLALAVLLSPKFDRNYSVRDDLNVLPPLVSLSEAQVLASEQNPEVRSAQASVKEAHSAATVARYAYLPSLALNVYYGIDANQFAARVDHPIAGTNRSNLPNTTVPSRQNLGYAADITLDIPVWNWGLTRSRVRQAEYRSQLAEVNLSFAERQLQANLRSLHRQAESALTLVASLSRSRDFAAENARLTLLRYKAGEATALEVAAAEDSSAQARNAYEDGLVHYHVAVANLQTLTGSL